MLPMLITEVLQQNQSGAGVPQSNPPLADKSQAGAPTGKALAWPVMFII